MTFKNFENLTYNFLGSDDGLAMEFNKKTNTIIWWILLKGITRRFANTSSDQRKSQDDQT